MSLKLMMTVLKWCLLWTSTVTGDNPVDVDQ